MKKLLLTTALTVAFTASIANATSVGGGASVGGSVGLGGTSVDANTRSSGSTSVDANTRSTGQNSVDANTRSTGGAETNTTGTVSGNVSPGVIDAPVNIDSDVQSETRINGSNSGYVRNKPAVQIRRDNTVNLNNGRVGTVTKDGAIAVPLTGGVGVNSNAR